MTHTSYESLLRDVYTNGRWRPDRTGVGVSSVFARQARFNLADGFPLVTTKRVHFHSVVTELLWFLRGDTNVSWLHDHGVTIWDEWAGDDGELGPIYGHQWRSWPTPTGGIDQITQVIESLRDYPMSRRHVVSAWNPSEIPDMALPPCHVLFQFYVDTEGRLSCQLYQRSADMFLGVPFNIASYALLTTLIAREVHLTPGEFIWTGGDCHIYANHMQQVGEQMTREPRPYPRLYVKPKQLFELEPDDIWVEDYNPWPKLSAPVAV